MRRNTGIALAVALIAGAINVGAQSEPLINRPAPVTTVDAPSAPAAIVPFDGTIPESDFRVVVGDQSAGN